jgi:hypothetical protein
MAINLLKTEEEKNSIIAYISNIARYSSRNMVLHLRRQRGRPVVNIKIFLYGTLILHHHGYWTKTVFLEPCASNSAPCPIGYLYNTTRLTFGLPIKNQLHTQKCT